MSYHANISNVKQGFITIANLDIRFSKEMCNDGEYFVFRISDTKNLFKAMSSFGTQQAILKIDLYGDDFIIGFGNVNSTNYVTFLYSQIKSLKIYLNKKEIDQLDDIDKIRELLEKIQ